MRPACEFCGDTIDGRPAQILSPDPMGDWNTPGLEVTYLCHDCWDTTLQRGSDYS